MKRLAEKGLHPMGIVERLLDQVISVKIINQVANYAATIIDAIIISSFFGSDAISAYGLVMPVFMLLSVVGGTIANGVSKFCGNRHYFILGNNISYKCCSQELSVPSLATEYYDMTV